MEQLSIIVCVAILSIPFIFYWRMSTNRKDWERLKSLLDEMRSIFSKARRGHIAKPESDKFFDYADEAIEIMSKPPFVYNNNEIPDWKDEVDKMSNQIGLIIAASSPKVSMGEELDKLATLREDGLISDREFKAFSERFRISTGEKASSILKAIAELSEQHKEGAMTEGNYHAALWSLLDKLDRKT